MTENYGPDDATIPAWEAPSGAPGPTSTARSAAPPSGAALPPGAPAQGLPTYRSWQPGFMPLRPLTMGDFISLPMKAIKFNRPVIVGGPLLCVIAVLVAVTVAVVLFVRDAEPSIVYGTQLAGVRPETIAAIVVAVLVAVFTTAAANAIVVPGVARGVLGERITLRQAWLTARPRVLRVALISFIFSLPSIALSILTTDFSALTDPYAAQPGGGSVLLQYAAMPVTYLLTVITYVSTAVVVLEHSGAFKAIGRSFTLIKGNMWRFIGITFVINLIVGFVVAIVAVAALVPIFIAGFTSSSLGTTLVVAVIAVFVLALLIAVFGYSYMGTFGTLIYIDLRIRKEGFDIDLAQAAEARSAR